MKQNFKMRFWQTLTQYGKCCLANTGSDYQGAIARLKSSVDTTVNDIAKQAGVSSGLDTSSILGKQWTDYNKKITELTIQEQNLQDRYYKTYSALDVALSKLQQQGDWLTKQLVGK